MIDEQLEIEETPDEKRRRLGRERTRKSRLKKKGLTEEIEITSFLQIAESWPRNDEQLLATDPKLHARLLARHEEVTGLEAEVTEILKGVGIYTWPPSPMKRAETLDANTPNPGEIFPMPDICFSEVKADVLKNGVANYHAIEAASIKGEQLDAEGEHYRRFGFRLRLSQETLQKVREALTLYALTTKDPNIDPEILAEAIADTMAFHGFSRNHDELRRLICDFKRQARVEEAPDG